MKYLFSVISSMIVMLCVRGVLQYIKNKNTSVADDSEVKANPVMLWIGIGGGVFFAIFALVSAFASEEIWVTIGFMAFALLGVVLCICFFNVRIKFDEKGFVYKTFFGNEYTYDYEDVVSFKDGNNVGADNIIICLNNGKKIKLDYTFQNREAFLEAVKKGSKKI